MAVFNLRSAKINFTEILSDVKIMEFPHCASSKYYFKLDVDPSIASLEQTIRLVWLRLLMKLSGGSQTREMDRLSNTRQMQLTCYLMSFKVFFIFPNVRSCDKIGRLLDMYLLRQCYFLENIKCPTRHLIIFFFGGKYNKCTCNIPFFCGGLSPSLVLFAPLWGWYLIIAIYVQLLLRHDGA